MKQLSLWAFAISAVVAAAIYPRIGQQIEVTLLLSRQL